jgi:hypothetical protein
VLLSALRRTGRSSSSSAARPRRLGAGLRTPGRLALGKAHVFFFRASRHAWQAIRWSGPGAAPPTASRARTFRGMPL